MAAERRPGNLAHLERLLNMWSRDGLDQAGTPHLAFKGGASMEFRFGVAGPGVTRC